jgi:heme/copper-type cytochrome/quinol oxidase subunit 2
MDSNSSIVPYLFMITFILVLGIAVWQYFKVTKARREQKQSADARVHGDQPGPVGGSEDRTRSR